MPGGFPFFEYPLPLTSSLADLLEAILAYLKADGTLAGLAAGGVFADGAPLGTALPYLVITETDGESDNEGGSGLASIEPVRFSISIFAVGKTPARQIRRYIAAFLEDAPLTFAAGSLLHLRAADRSGMVDPERGPGGADIWQEIQNFQAVVGHGS